MNHQSEFLTPKNDTWERALEAAGMGVWDWDLRTGACSYSEPWCRMLGYEKGELQEDEDLWLSLIHPDDRELAIQSGNRHIAGETESIETELRLRHKNGHWVWVLDRGGIVERDNAGQPLRLVGVQTEITRQKQAEQKLGLMNERFRLALAASGLGIWHFDVDRQKGNWDARTRAIFGLNSDFEDIDSKTWHQFLHPDDLAQTERDQLRAFSENKEVKLRYRIIREDGEIRHVETLSKSVPEDGSSGYLVGTIRDITEEAHRQQELAFAARHDALTGLFNRVAFDEALEETIGASANATFATLYIDLDHFKALNDFAGHAAGDEALSMISTDVAVHLPANAVFARLGGDEFAILLPGSGVENAKKIASDVIAAVSNVELRYTVTHQRLGCSIGIAVVNDRSITAADALARADDACYAAKSAGRNRYVVFAEYNNVLTSGLTAARCVADLTEALEENRVLLFGQEIRSIDRPHEWSGRVEILARLQDRDGKIVPPGVFIPAAERFGMASTLDRRIIRDALKEYGPVMEASDLKLGFNLSAQTLCDPHLWSFIQSAVEESGASYSHIGFEITETAAVTCFESADQFVRDARHHGCPVSLDDFGSGLSSFDYLRRFPISCIKIDGAFVEKLTESKFDRAIVSSVVGIATDLGLEVVAEKIEDEATLAQLRRIGVSFGQGFHLHRPEPLADLVARRLDSSSQKTAMNERRSAG